MMKIRVLCFFVAVLIALGGCVSAMEDGEMKQMKFYGPMGERFDANLKNWLLTAPYQNPGIVQMYFRRNQPHQVLVPWYGEFSGKYLTSAALCYMMQPDEELKQTCDYVVEQLYKAQDDDGYLGVWPDREKLCGKNQNGHKTWDAWSHYHNMIGLYLWNKATGNETALEIINKTIDCLYDFFIVKGNKVDEDKDGTDAALGHIFTILYQETKDPRCLEMVQKVMKTFEDIFGGDYYNAGLQNKPFYKMNRTRWECLHAIQTIKGLYDITGEESYRISFANIWDGIMRYDRHNTGGFSSGERACGNPYDLRAIETCCTIAWMALSVDMLKMTGDPYVADELELTTWNGLIGAQQSSGRSFTYNTPMEGDKKASAHDIVFQAIAGSSELNCCSVNGPRGFGMIGQWGLTAEGEQLTINYYGASETTLTTDKGYSATVVQSGSYPFGPDIKLKFDLESGYTGSVRLRIPCWSKKTAITLNAQPTVQEASPGTYFVLDNIKTGDVVEIELDMSPHYWQGNYELGGKTALYTGPILLACDQRFNNGVTNVSSPIKLSNLKIEPIECPDTLYPEPYLLVKASDGKNNVILCDFASAGQTGTTYTTWLSTEKELPVLRESSEDIIWIQRVKEE